MERVQFMSAGKIDEAEWSIMEIQLPAGRWRYEEPSAQITSLENGVEIRVDKFALKGLPDINPTDTGKHFYMSKRKFELPVQGTAKLSVDMAAQEINADGQNYQYGFANTILQDAERSLIFDSASTGKRVFSIYEKLFVPGLVKAEDAFTYITEAPFAVITHNLEWHTHSIELDLQRKSAIWQVDGKTINKINGLEEVPQSFHIGFGLFTLVPYVNGLSESLHGQGMLGRWRNLSFVTN